MYKDMFEERIIEIVKEHPTMSYNDIAKIIGCSKGTVQYYFNKLGIKRDRIAQQKINNTDRNTKIEITNRAMEIFNGLLLGDGSIAKYRRDCPPIEILNSCIYCNHSYNQREYVLFLKELIEKEGIITHYRETTKITYRSIMDHLCTSNGCSYLTTRRSITFNKLRDLWYPNGKKIVPREIVNNFSVLSLAIWFMDDGSKHPCSYYIHSQGFTLEDNQFLCEMLKNKFGIETAIHKAHGVHTPHPVIYIKAESRKLFTEIVSPYIPDSMKYKLHIIK